MTENKSRGLGDVQQINITECILKEETPSCRFFVKGFLNESPTMEGTITIRSCKSPMSCPNHRTYVFYNAAMITGLIERNKAEMVKKEEKKPIPPSTSGFNMDASDFEPK